MSIRSILNCPHHPHIPMWQHWLCILPLLRSN